MVEREIARLKRRKAYKRVMRGILISLVLLIAVITIVMNLWIAVLQVNSSGMKPLLEMDEIVLVIRTEALEKNDVIACYHNGTLQIKRIVAVAGEAVSIDADGVVSVNGEELDEPYVAEPNLGDGDIDYPFLIPAGTVFVLGDNRLQSMDSRRSEFGPVSREKILGKVIYRIWPLSRFEPVA